MYNQDGQIPGAFTAYQQQQLQQQQQQAMSMDGGGHYNSYQAAAALAHHQVGSCLHFHAGGAKGGTPIFVSTKTTGFQQERNRVVSCSLPFSWTLHNLYGLNPAKTRGLGLSRLILIPSKGFGWAQSK